MSGFVILLIVVGVLVLMAIGIYNTLVSLRNRVTQSFADIDVQLKQRHDLIPNLVETVKGYAAHEAGTLEAVIQARNSAMSAGGGTAAQAQAEGMLGAALGRLIALSSLTSKTRLPPRGASSITPSMSTTPVCSNSRPSCSRAPLASRSGSPSISAKAACRSRPRRRSSFKGASAAR